MRHSLIKHPLARVIVACLAFGTVAAHAQDASTSDPDSLAKLRSALADSDSGSTTTRTAPTTNGLAR